MSYEESLEYWRNGFNVDKLSLGIKENLSKYFEKEPSNSQLKYRYGITLKDYDKMFDDQGGCCDICGEIPFRHSLQVDHCHETGKVRALLCRNCNTALGHFKDNPIRMLKAAKYVMNHHSDRKIVVDNKKVLC